MKHPVFVYGILKGRVDAQPGFVHDYRLVDMGWFPAAIPADDAKISGELIFVSDEELEGFDRIEGHPNFYIRTDVEVEVGDGSQTELVHAEMYVINSEYHDRMSEPTHKLDIVDGTYEYHP